MFAAVLCQVWSYEDYNLDDEDHHQAANPSVRTFTSTSAEDSWRSDYIADPIFRQRYRKLQTDPNESGGQHHSNSGGEKEGFSIHEDGTLRFLTILGERICLPASRISETLKLSHDVLGHFGTAKTYERISSVYYRPGLSSIVASYVRHCPKCITNKTSRSKMPGSLAPIDALVDATRVPSAFESVNMDLIVSLPKSNGFDAILVIIDRFTKTGIFAPTTSDFTAESIAEVFVEKLVSRGFLPSKFITDRDPRLIMSFWKTLCRRLNIDHRKTTAFHAQTDGAAERMNQTLEIALRNYVSPRQNNWAKHLYLMELAYNTSKSATTGFAPYELLYSQPQNPVERILRPNIPPASEDIDMDVNESADDLLLDNATRLRDAQQSIVMAMAAQKEYYDRRHGPIPKFKVGDYASIRLDRHPVSIIKRNKLSQQKLPPYKILKINSNGRAVQLEIPPTLSIHPTISIQHLEPAPPPGEDPWKRNGGSGELTIVDHRPTRGGTKKYRIHWEGLGADQDEWRVKKKIPDESLVQQYEDSISGEAFLNTIEILETAPPRKVDEVFQAKPPSPSRPVERPVLFISRTTKPYEKGYGATELELACVSWAWTRLRHYLEGSKTVVISDHQRMREVLESSPATQFSTRIDKFRMLLMPGLDDMTILYKLGPRMTNVNPLSRARYVDTPEVVMGRDGGEGRETRKKDSLKQRGEGTGMTSPVSTED